MDDLDAGAIVARIHSSMNQSVSKIKKSSGSIKFSTMFCPVFRNIQVHHRFLAGGHCIAMISCLISKKIGSDMKFSPVHLLLAGTGIALIAIGGIMLPQEDQVAPNPASDQAATVQIGNSASSADQKSGGNTASDSQSSETTAESSANVSVVANATGNTNGQATVVDATAGEVSKAETAAEPPLVVPKTSGAESVAANTAGKTTGSKNTATQDQASPLAIDVARIRPDGTTVIAGQATPEAEVFVLSNGSIIGKAKANAAGEWVVVLENPLSAGSHLLALEEKSATGNRRVGEMALAVELEELKQEKPLVALVPYTDEAAQSARILQQPTTQSTAQSSLQTTTETVASSASSGQHPVAEQLPISPYLSVSSLVRQEDGQWIISGVARGGERLLLTVDGTPLDASLEDNGRFVARGQFDEVTDKALMRGRLFKGETIVARMQLQLRRQQLLRGFGGDTLIIVQKGDALWRIAYQSYGKGIRYVDIFMKNREAIEDPDLIYPNQIFALPKQ